MSETRTLIDPETIDWEKPAAVGQAVEALADRLAAEHGTSSSAFRRGLLAGCKEIVRLSRRHAEESLIRSRKGLECARYLSEVQDELITALYTLASTRLYPAINPTAAERVSVIAVGGYGRGTLAPGSDIDLLFVLPFRKSSWGEQIAEFLLYMLWDLGFKVGHSSRTVDECIRLSHEDNTILTATLEARYICGDEKLYAELVKRFRKEVVARDPAGFIAQKLAERDERHRRHGESRYLVEPDVKEGKGGLRDLHTLFWIGKYLYGVQDVSGLVDHGVFTRAELRRFLRAEDFFWAVRCHMHFIAGRGDDKLSFDMQPKVAERMGYVAAGRLKHVERFMRHYFLHAKEVGDLTGIFCAVLEEQQMKPAPRLSRFISGFLKRSENRELPDHPGFLLENGRLAVKGESVFREDPVNLLRLFAIADQLDVSIHPRTLTLVRRSLRLIDDEVRNNPEANAIFLKLLCDSRDPESALRKLNEADVLGRFIPDFGRIVALMQFNMYHHYTVDEHLIRTVGWLARIDRGELAREHPLSTEVIRKIKNRRALYVAAFLHDIAKGRQESHSIAGERIARRLCPRLGLSHAETETVAWLVRHHLLMSETSQMRDLSDFKTVLDFAEVVQSPERLRLLLILTVVDIRAVGPGVWNGWKGQLLRTLYHETEPVVSGGHASVPLRQRVAAAQQAFAERIGWPEDRLKAYLERHYDPYWITTDTEHQLRHARLIERAEKEGEKIAIDIHTDAFTAITEITVYTPDHPHLLGMLTGACAAAGANIAGAKIFTTANGWALDTILLQRQFSEDEDELRRARRVAETIRKALTGEIRLSRVLAEKPKEPSGRARAFHVAPQVVIDNDSSNRFTIIEVAGKDRIGLLYELTTALFDLNLNIVSAHIATYGERAVDVFYVTDLTGAKITSAARRQTIRRTLMKVLGDDGSESSGSPGAATGRSAAE
jgi:[protein-PII] uridylyltransferase